MRNWNLREFRVQVNLPSQIWQLRVPIWSVITLLNGPPSTIGQAVPLISHIRSPSSTSFASSSPSLSFSSITLLLSQNRKFSHHSLSLHVMIMSWHRVQHTTSTAFTQDWLSSLYSHDYELTPECRMSSQHASLLDRPPTASSPWELKGKVTLLHSHGCELTDWWIEFQDPACRSLTASQYSSKLTRSWPWSVFPNSLDYGLQVCSIMASKCISPSSLDYGL